MLAEDECLKLLERFECSIVNICDEVAGQVEVAELEKSEAVSFLEGNTVGIFESGWKRRPTFSY